MDTRPLEEQLAADLTGIIARIGRALDEIALSADRDRVAKLLAQRDAVRGALTAFSA